MNFKPTVIQLYFRMWIEEMMSNYDDVWIVPVRAGIEFMKNPVPKDELDFFEPFGCYDLPEFTCFSPRDCRSEKNTMIIVYFGPLLSGIVNFDS